MEQIMNQVSDLQETCNRLDDLLQVIKKSEWRKSISKAVREYNLKIYNLNKLTPLRVKELHTIIVSKFYKSDRSKEYWNENELRLFIWMTFAYAGALGRGVASFGVVDWTTLAACFADKSPFFCEFQFKCLKKVSENSDKWSKEEEELLQIIIAAENDQDPEKVKWNDIAKQFYMRSDKLFFRTAKQCRQHWNTYLDPNKLKCGWSFNEDLLLVKAVIDFGRKWSRIAHLLENKRSEHTVKNRYNSLISKYLKVKNIHNGKDSVEAQHLYEWLSYLEKEPELQSIAKVEVPSQPPAPSENKIQQDQQQQYLEPLKAEERHEFIPMMASHNMIEKAQSPAMLISPLPLNFGSIVFSPLNIYYRGDNDGGFNLFSFENLRQ